MATYAVSNGQLIDRLVGQPQKKQLNHPLIRGWLQKRSRHMKQWRKRWVILQEFGVYTFKK